MALKGQKSFDNGIVLTDAYFKITKISFNNTPEYVNSVEIIVSVFMDENTRRAGKSPVTQYSHYCSNNDYYLYFGEDVISVTGNTVFVQAYKYLKDKCGYGSAISVMDEKEQ